MMYGNANDMLFFCDQLRKAREAAGLSQEELAERLDVSYMTIHRFESGKRMPSIDLIFRFMEATNTSISSQVDSREQKAWNPGMVVWELTLAIIH